MRQNKRTMLGIIFVVMALMAALLISGQKLNSKLAASETEITALQEQTDEENARTKEIEAMQQNMQSSEYKEQIAKDKLGLIKDGEIIFKESDN